MEPEHEETEAQWGDAGEHQEGSDQEHRGGWVLSLGLEVLFGELPSTLWAYKIGHARPAEAVVARRAC